MFLSLSCILLHTSPLSTPQETAIPVEPIIYTWNVQYAHFYHNKLSRLAILMHYYQWIIDNSSRGRHPDDTNNYFYSILMARYEHMFGTSNFQEETVWKKMITH